MPAIVHLIFAALSFCLGAAVALLVAFHLIDRLTSEYAEVEWYETAVGIAIVAVSAYAACSAVVACRG